MDHVVQHLICFVEAKDEAARDAACMKLNESLAQGLTDKGLEPKLMSALIKLQTILNALPGRAKA